MFSFDVNQLAEQAGQASSALVQALRPAAESVAETVGATLPDLWGYGVAWQRAEGVAMLAVMGLVAAVLLSIFAVSFAVAAKRSSDLSDDLFVVSALVCGFAGVIGLIGAAATARVLVDAVIHVMAPEAMLMVEIAERATALIGK